MDGWRDRGNESVTHGSHLGRLISVATISFPLPPLGRVEIPSVNQPAEGRCGFNRDA